MRKYQALILVGMLMLTGGYVCAQQKQEPISTDTVSVYYKEKVYLHLDRAYYASGENIWFKAYLNNADDNKPQLGNNVVYVDLIRPNGHLMDSEVIRVKDGHGHGDFLLPPNLDQGEYIIRGYTNYMRNFDDSFFFRKRIYINGVAGNGESTNSMLVKEGDLLSDGLTLKFFPEGGNLVAGTLNKVVFKALDKASVGVPVAGYIRDFEGNQVTSLEGNAFGMGIVAFVPNKGETYSAVVSYEGEEHSFILPQVQDQGTLLQISDGNQLFYISIQSSVANGLKGYSLKGMQGNEMVYEAEIVGDAPKVALKVPKNELKPGIVKFNLLDQEGIVIKERLVFNDTNFPDIGITTAKQPVKDSLSLSVALRDKANTQIDLGGAYVSVSITNIAVSSPIENQADIVTHFLLDGLLKEEVQHAGYYLYSEDPKRKQDLDVLLLTQKKGQLLLDDGPLKSLGDTIFHKESGITISGRTMDQYKKRPIKTDVALAYKNKDGSMGYSKGTTDSQGYFVFPDTEIWAGDKIVLHATNKNNPNGKYAIAVDSLQAAPISMRTVSRDVGGQGDSYSSYIKSSNREGGLSTDYFNEPGIINLEEVQLKAAKKKERERLAQKRFAYSQASNTLDFRDLRDKPYLNFLDAIRGRIPGVDVRGDQIVIRGVNSLLEYTGASPMFLLDGAPVDASIVHSIVTSEIDFVDVLKGSRASIFGSQGGNGVIAIYTLDAEGYTVAQKDDDKTVLRVNKGYYRARDFYGTELLLQQGAVNKAPTLYWNPDIALNKEGNTTVVFPSWLTGAYTVRVEGITKDGIPFSAETDFSIDQSSYPR